MHRGHRSWSPTSACGTTWLRVTEEGQRDSLWGWTELRVVGNLLQSCQ